MRHQLLQCSLLPKLLFMRSQQSKLQQMQPAVMDTHMVQVGINTKQKNF